MPLTRRSLLTATGASALGGVLAGCSGNLPKTDTRESHFGKDASGRVEVWCRGATQDGIAAIVKAFHAHQHRIRVRVTPVPDAEFVTKLATSIRSRRVPDLVDFDDINSLLFSYRGAFADITEPVSRLPGAQGLSPGHLKLGTLKKRRYGLPFLADNSVLFCNTELFERAHIDVDEATTSLEHLLEAARKISRLGNDIYGWSFPGNSPGTLGFTVQPHIWAADTDLISGHIGRQRPNVKNNKAAKDTLAFLHTLWREKLVPPKSYSDDGSQFGADYAQGKIGIFPANYQAMTQHASKSLQAKSVIRLIPGPEGGRSFFDGGDNLCLLNGAQNPSAAWEFAAFCVAPDQQQLLPQAGFVPIRADAVTPKFRDENRLAVQTVNHLDAGYAPKTMAYNVIYNQADGPWLKMFRRAVFTGEIEAAMADAQHGYSRLLEEAQR